MLKKCKVINGNDKDNIKKKHYYVEAVEGIEATEWVNFSSIFHQLAWKILEASTIIEHRNMFHEK